MKSRLSFHSMAKAASPSLRERFQVLIIPILPVGKLITAIQTLRLNV